MEVVAPGTVNTAPEKTLEAVADHGVVRGNTIVGSYDEARELFAELTAVGIDLDDAYDVLESEGLKKFVDSWDELATTVTQAIKRQRVGRTPETTG